LSRPRVESAPLDLDMLIDGPKTRIEMGATMYTVRTCEREGLIERAGKEGNNVLWKLSRKGRNYAKKGLAGALPPPLKVAA